MVRNSSAQNLSASARNSPPPFSASQLAFLMTKMKITDDFIAEAIEFKVKRTVKPKTLKDVGPIELCTKLKKNGSPCTYKAKSGGLCGKHTPKTYESECVGCGEKTRLQWVSVNGPKIYGCEPCVEAGAIEDIDEDYL